MAAWQAALATVLALAIVGAAYWLPSGRWAEAADAITPLTGHILIGGAAAVSALIFRRVALAIMTAGVMAALVGHPLLSLSWRQSPPLATLHPASHDRLKVYALNSWDENPDLPRLERALEAVDADVMVLAEADPSKVAMIERLRARYPYQTSCAHLPVCSMAILSRLPIINGMAARNQMLVPPIAWAQIDAHSRGLGTVTVVGTHVHRPTRNPWIHAQQMRALTEMLANTKGPLILAGDLNTGPWSVAYRALIKQTGLVDATRLMPTWPAYPFVVPQVALDHILVSPDLEVSQSGVAAATGSDHLPVVADVGLRGRMHVSAQP